MQKKIKIIADDKIPFLKGVLEPFADIEYYPGKLISNDKIKNADALIVRTRTKCNEELLQNSNVKLITTATIGFDHIDTKYCKDNNITWLNAPGCNSGSVKQYISSVLFTISAKEKFLLKNKTIGIIGVGNVGSKVQNLAEILGMNVLLNDPPRERKEGSLNFCNFDKIIEEADIITFHVPLNKEGIDKTYHLANEEFFGKLRRKPIIINSSRGEVVKTYAVKDAVKSKKVGNVILDVWENEPEIDQELLSEVDIATPHIAGYSADGKANGTSVCVNAVNEFFQLGMQTNWQPENIPLAINGSELVIDGKDKSQEEIISEAVLKTYNVLEDDKKLRNSVGTFEKQRGDYPIRREFQNYSLFLSNVPKGTIDKLIELEFKIKYYN